MADTRRAGALLHAGALKRSPKLGATSINSWLWRRGGPTGAKTLSAQRKGCWQPDGSTKPCRGRGASIAADWPMCETAWGPDADRRRKALIYLVP
ncbi:hypothetical protein GGD83_005101, partial [Rhodoblastus sphagnicola]|nr:hypothetical protein [Rhodoblastus sphagnicola]